MVDQHHRIGRNREGAGCLVVAGVPDVENREALAGADPRFVVHLGDEGAYRVHDVAVVGACTIDDLGRTAVGRQHEWRAGRNVVHTVQEDTGEDARNATQRKLNRSAGEKIEWVSQLTYNDPTQSDALADMFNAGYENGYRDCLEGWAR